MTTSVAYCTREQVQSALDFKESARNSDQVDRAIYAASQSVEGLLHRSFYPVTATRYFRWPNRAGSSYRLWLNDNELISVSTLTSGGTTIGSSSYYLEPNSSGPPYESLELIQSSSAVFGGGSTAQRDIAITGVWGYQNTTSPAGTVTEALDASETGVDCSNSAAVGVGSVILVDTERMLVTGKSLVDTTQDTQSAMNALNSDQIVDVTDGTAFHVGEVITVDAEQMKLVDIAGNNLIVKRAWNGSTLAAHLTATSVYAPRTLEVARGGLGTTAATHLTSATLQVQTVPALVQELAIAEACNYLLQESAGYGRTVGTGESETQYTGAGLAAIRKQAKAQHGRKARMRTV